MRFSRLFLAFLIFLLILFYSTSIEQKHAGQTWGRMNSPHRNRRLRVPLAPSRYSRYPERIVGTAPVASVHARSPGRSPDFQQPPVRRVFLIQLHPVLCHSIPIHHSESLT